MTYEASTQLSDVYPSARIAQVIADVESAASARGLDPSSLLYCGINPDLKKPDGGEHSHPDGTHNFYLGTRRSLEDPALLSDDPELQGEHWVVNPIHYALDGGVLAVYVSDQLSSDPATKIDEIDDEFGTVIVRSTLGSLARHELFRLPVIKSQ